MSSIRYTLLDFKWVLNWAILYAVVYKIVTKGLNISGWLGILAVLMLAILGWWFFSGGPDAFTPAVTSDETRPAAQHLSDISPDPEFYDEDLDQVVEPGFFGEYDEQYIASLPTDSRVVLFFVSLQCSSCQHAIVSILTNRAAIPSDIHILLVDHVASPELRRVYEVSVPHTFVEITTDGTFIQSWRASRDLQSILARL